MSLALDDVRRGSGPLLSRLLELTDVVAQQNATITALQIERDTVRSEHEAARAEIEKLRLLIRQLQRDRFGRRSERLDPDQLQLGLEDLEQTAAAAEAAQEEAAARSGTPRTPRVRRRNLGSLPAHLPRVEVLVDLEDKNCPCCGGAMQVIGEDTSEMLDIVPAQLRVKVIRRPRYGCRACEEAVVQAPAPERPITGGMASEALLAQVLVAKYGDHLPLYRQAGIFARSPARRGSSPGRGSGSTAPRSATGWGGPAGGSSRSGACCAGTSWPRPGPSPATPRCRCSTPAAVGPRPAGCGATPSTTGPGVGAPRRRWSTSTPKTARASIPPPTWPSSKASCRWTATAASRACSRTARRARSGSPSAGRTADDAFMTSTRRPARPWRKRRCGGPPSSTRSKRRSAAARPRRGARSGRSAASRLSRPCMPGSRSSWRGSRASPVSPRQSATPCATGPGWCCSSTTAGSSRTPTPSSASPGLRFIETPVCR